MNSSFALDIWWNLNILRATLNGGGQSNLTHLSPAGLSNLGEDVGFKFVYIDFFSLIIMIFSRS